MKDEPIKELGKIFIDKDGAFRVYISKKIAKQTNFKNKQRVKIYYYPIEKRIVIEELNL